MWRFFGFLFAAGSVLFIVAAMAVYIFLNSMMQGLPDFTALRNYEPPVMTRIHAGNGELMAEYARQRRLFLPIQAIPDRVKQAFLSAEDKNFYDHAGIDYFGIGRAVLTNIRNYGQNRRLVGASTITQQVAKNFLLTSEQSYERKIKEALLSMRIEQAFSKDEILELYLNEIFLGIGSYGIGSAALHYFDKSVHELNLAEIGYLAALPKAPNNYHPIRRTDKAIERRNWVIDQMVNNGYVTVEEANQAKAMDLEVKMRSRGAHIFAADYFAEEVRRWIGEEFGEDKLYNGGLSVRTSLNVGLQQEARKALSDGLVAFDHTKGWRGPVTTIDPSGDWGRKLAKVEPLSDVPEWQLAVILSAEGKEASVGLRPEIDETGKLSAERTTGVISVSDLKWAKWESGDRKGKAVKAVSDVFQPGDVVYVSSKGEGSKYDLQQVPEVSGALIAMDPYTGRVLAMAGGFSFAQSQFNRATQAYRQPGSSFKPFVYATALDNGYTPSSVVMDAPIEIQQGGGQGIWRPQNYGGKFYGPSTLRLGIERSRNVMTVRLAQDMGMPLVAEYAQRFGIYDNLMPVLSMALGAGETTVLRMATAYSMLANGGRRITPTFVDRVQDRYGKTIYKHDQRICEQCNVQSWAYQDEPQVVDNREQVLDPMTAYQITSMMEGVVLRGTAPVVRKVGKPIAGKTGTTNDERDAWFVGYSPDLVVGVYVGYDRPRPMGRKASGGGLAAPIFTDFMKVALADQPKKPFPVPEGLQLIPIDRRTGLRESASGEGVILEAFKPGTAPPDSYSIIGFTEDMGRPVSAQEAERALTQGTGGLY
ncbi:penicillin-binding protein 1A [Cohaesibacter intestini]|uniref:penicillin-binding protein 1A n=1 Tax=Cohaesibacter intestini TaxID=2211145 RepID=UPI000DE81959|nr:penicillin-binding protein 1A [Cohaesibacter intestini]